MCLLKGRECSTKENNMGRGKCEKWQNSLKMAAELKFYSGIFIEMKPYNWEYTLGWMFLSSATIFLSEDVAIKKSIDVQGKKPLII